MVRSGDGKRNGMISCILITGCYVSYAIAQSWAPESIICFADLASFFFFFRFWSELKSLEMLLIVLWMIWISHCDVRKWFNRIPSNEMTDSGETLKRIQERLGAENLIRKASQARVLRQSTLKDTPSLSPYC
ncbi:hypothetical protein CDAR_228751 [Caerostris darwini]|uniref:Uncharacterized protein n=1 Tax=Caerostris darwini TaxID=1538125 RepID=A0AAV4PFB6_9ARAC|nr:hypothetical protein CDAR_228751 [Caerostris darwini]